MDIRQIMQDFRRRWGESYVWVEHPDSKEESLFFVDSILDDRQKIATISLSSPEYGKILLNYGTAHVIKFKYPPVGVFQNGPDAYIFRRVPAKQYVRGVSHSNSVVGAVWSAITGRSIRRQDSPLKFDDVLAAYKGEKFAFVDALKMLGSGKYRSVALQRNWSLCLSPATDGQYILLFWETPVAVMDTAGNVSYIYEKQFEAVLQQVKES